MYLQLSAQMETSGREVGLALETWQLVQEANFIEIMGIWTRHASQGGELKYASTCGFPSALYNERIWTLPIYVS